MSRFSELVAIVKRLRGPGGCPWDREQTPESLRGCLLEEAYEVLDAITTGEPPALQDELGDLLLQVLFQAELAAEADHFTIEHVIASAIDKMVRRHPHVFGDTVVADTAEVLRNWARIKSEERAAQSDASDHSILSGLPPELPALHAAHRTGEKVSRVGFDWASVEGALDKVREEIDELAEALATREPERIEHELGDALFALTSLGRLAGQHAEMALRAALTRFGGRFRRMEQSLRDQGRDIHAVTPEELDALWNEAKAAEGPDRSPSE